MSAQTWVRHERKQKLTDGLGSGKHDRSQDNGRAGRWNRSLGPPERYIIVDEARSCRHGKMASRENRGASSDASDSTTALYTRL